MDLKYTMRLGVESVTYMVTEECNVSATGSFISYRQGGDTAETGTSNAVRCRYVVLEKSARQSYMAWSARQASRGPLPGIKTVVRADLVAQWRGS